VGPRAVLNAVVKRKIPSPSRESKPRTPIFQPVAQRYTTELSRLLYIFNSLEIVVTAVKGCSVLFCHLVDLRCYFVVETVAPSTTFIFIICYILSFIICHFCLRIRPLLLTYQTILLQKLYTWKTQRTLKNNKNIAYALTHAHTHVPE
jgi:hypothetical protein